MKNLVKPLRGNKALTWTLRILLFLVALFFLIFSFDVFGEGRSTWEVIRGFLVHNIITFILLIILWVAWKWEHIGGYLLLSLGLSMVIFFGDPLHIMCGTWLMISHPVLLGILFLCNYYLIRRKKNSKYQKKLPAD
jgi:hypothetical protein